MASLRTNAYVGLLSSCTDSTTAARAGVRHKTADFFFAVAPPADDRVKPARPGAKEGDLPLSLAEGMLAETKFQDLDERLQYHSKLLENHDYRIERCSEEKFLANCFHPAVHVVPETHNQGLVRSV